MATRTIRNCIIESNGDVNHGLDYIENNWESAIVEKALTDSRNYDDQMAHFSANIEGSVKHYILKHIKGNTFFLKPND